MPSNVSWFEKLMYTVLVLGLVNLAIDGQRLAAAPELRQIGGVAFLAVVAILTDLILILLIWLAARRRKNWARWVMAVLFAVGLIPAIPTLAGVFQANPAAGGIMVVQSVLQIVALVLVFSGNARPWFAAQRPSPLA